MAERPDVPARRANVLVRRVVSEAGRADALAVLAATYHAEKQWVADAESQFPLADIASDDVAWFVAYVGGRSAGVVRILHNPPIAVYARYGLTSLDPANRIEDFIGRPDLAEVGRFAVLPDRRGQYLVAAALMRAARLGCGAGASATASCSISAACSRIGAGAISGRSLWMTSSVWSETRGMVARRLASSRKPPSSPRKSLCSISSLAWMPEFIRSSWPAMRSSNAFNSGVMKRSAFFNVWRRR